MVWKLIAVLAAVGVATGGTAAVMWIEPQPQELNKGPHTWLLMIAGLATLGQVVVLCWIVTGWAVVALFVAALVGTTAMQAELGPPFTNLPSTDASDDSDRRS